MKSDDFAPALKAPVPPTVSLYRGHVRDFGWMRRGLLVLLIFMTTLVAAYAQSYSVLTTFNINGLSGSGPYPLVQGFDGNFYGVTISGGPSGPTDAGTIFRVTPTGTLTTIFDFCPQSCANGMNPVTALALGTDGNLYGTASGGGANLVGTAFKMTPSGTYTLLYTFCRTTSCTEGDFPKGTLLLAPDGNFYGTTWSSGFAPHKGGIFKLTPSGTLTPVYEFCIPSGCPDGGQPLAGLIEASDGNFYGTASGGGSKTPDGTIFKVNSAGVLKTLYRFSGPDGQAPAAPLVQGRDGNFYGTTELGGANGHGTVFKITPAGVLTTLYNFCSQTGCADGSDPTAGLTLATKGNFYGSTTGAGGTNTNGTIFEITSAGTLTTLHSFAGGADGAFPTGALLQATDGNLYGTTAGDGIANWGTIYVLGVGLSPNVNSVPTSGNVGTGVTILGTNLTGATKVAFNGVSSSFTVVSSSEITTTVPTGATTGKIKVMTPSGVLSTSFNFRVTP
jgi:uncharacterized repeat protein (TIGR03803 family)